MPSLKEALQVSKTDIQGNLRGHLRDKKGMEEIHMAAIPRDNHLDVLVLLIEVNEGIEEQPHRPIIGDLKGKEPETKAMSEEDLQRKEAESIIRISGQDQITGDGRELSPKATKIGATNASRQPNSF